MNKKNLALFALLSLSSSMAAFAHTVEFKTESRGAKGDFTTSYTNPQTGKTDSNVNGGRAQFIFQDINLKHGQKLSLEHSMTASAAGTDGDAQKPSVNLCVISIDKRVVASKIQSNGRCAVEYTYTGR